MRLDVELWDAAANAGQGSRLAAGSIELDWKAWRQGAVNRRSLQLKGTADSSKANIF